MAIDDTIFFASAKSLDCPINIVDIDMGEFLPQSYCVLHMGSPPGRQDTMITAGSNSKWLAVIACKNSDRPGVLKTIDFSTTSLPIDGANLG